MGGHTITFGTTRAGRRLRAALVALLLAAGLATVAAATPAAADGNEAPSPNEFRELSVGGQHACAIRLDGTVKCWGQGTFGALGQTNNANRGDNAGEMGNNLPTVDLGTGRTATAISVADGHSCALLDNSTVKCWGDNTNGKLGYGDTTTRGTGAGQMGDNLPAIALGTGRTATAISAGAGHTCAILDNGSVKCWGLNASGQLGQGSTAALGDGANEMGDNLPAIALGTGRTATALSLGTNHTCARLDNGTVKCWGIGSNGSLGYGNATTRGDQANEMGDNLPAVDLGAGRTATAISTAGATTCALLDNATVKCWGSNNNGQLGQGDNTGRGLGAGQMGDNLAPIALGTGRTALGVSTTGSATCVLLDNASVKCFGLATAGLLGDGQTANNRGDAGGEMGDALPTVSLGAGRTAKAVTGGNTSFCVLLDNDTRKCWGGNGVGQLGLGDNANRGDAGGEMGDNLPIVDLGTEVAPDTTDPTATITTPADDATFDLDEAVDADYSCADDVAIATCVGDVADGTEIDTSTVGPHTFTVTATDTSGNDVEVTNDYTVEGAPASSEATAVSAGLTHACALLDDGSVKCWGSNNAGQLGLGDTDNRGDGTGEMGDDLPAVDLGTGRTATAIVARVDYTCALLDNSTVKCWGEGADGRLGQGDTTDRGDNGGEMGDSLPAINLGAGRTATAITAGAIHTCALLDNGSVKCWGGNSFGILGLGDTTSRGDNGGEMGDSLPAVSLGAGRTATAIRAGGNVTCALLDNSTVKCWGANGVGQLGQGDTAFRGDNGGEMGDALPAVNLGAGRTATAIDVGGAHTCARLDNNTVKCWGFAGNGQLGQGDTNNRGDNGGEMGDALPAVNLGTGRTATAISADGDLSCARLDNASVKCWGANVNGALGLGDTNNRGDNGGEMGDALPAVNLGTGRTATAVDGGITFICVLRDDSTITCWGDNASGQLGQGDTTVRGDNAGELGDALPAIELGGSGGPVDTTDPTVTLTTPGVDDAFDLDEDVTVEFSCNDDVAIATCVGTLADEAIIDTSTVGAFTFTVTATDTAGNDTVVTHDYVVDGEDPTVTLMTPSEDDEFDLNEAVTADFSCADDVEVATCVGSVADGATIPTGTPGTFTFTVTATDLAGKQTVESHDYTVIPPAVCDGQAVTVNLNFGQTPTTGNDVILGRPVADNVNGLAGNDRMCGGGGNDTLNGGADNDRIFGQGGNDRIIGGVGNDRVDGGDGVDHIDGNDGVDNVIGGNGNDRLYGGNGKDTETGGAGDDRLDGGAAEDNLNGGDGNDTLISGDADDVLTGGNGNDYFEGGFGDDVLSGQAGTDTLNANQGADRLNGGTQRDICDGGAQRDTAAACEVLRNIP